MAYIRYYIGIIYQLHINFHYISTVQEQAMTYKIIPGVRLKSQIFLDNLNHRYYKSKSRINKM